MDTGNSVVLGLAKLEATKCLSVFLGRLYIHVEIRMIKPTEESNKHYWHHLCQQFIHRISPDVASNW